MIDVYNVQSKSLLPPSIKEDKTIRDICDTLDEHLNAITAECYLLLLIPRLGELPSELLDALAWQFHVDFYDYNSDLDEKRFAIRQALYYHKIKGTPKVLDIMLEQYYDSGTIEENWQYGGNPYCFRINVGVDDKQLKNTINGKLGRLIYAFKNVRSHFDGFHIKREADMKAYWGGICGEFRHVEIGG